MKGLATLEFAPGPCGCWAAVATKPEKYLAEAAFDSSADIRATAVRLARQLESPLEKTLQSLAYDPSPEVRRECAVALRNAGNKSRSRLWADLAAQYDGLDRWYLEALGIGADGDWDDCLSVWMDKVQQSWKLLPSGRDIVWRSRAAITPELLAAITEDVCSPRADLPRNLRAFDFLKGPEKNRVLASLAFDNRLPNDLVRKFVIPEAIERLDRNAVLSDRAHLAALKRAVAASRGTAQFLDLIQRFDLPGYSDDVLSFAQSNSENEFGVRAVMILLSRRENARIAAALSSSDAQIVENTVSVLGNALDPRANELLWPIANDRKRPIDVRRQAIRAIARTKGGAGQVMTKAEAGKLDEGLREAAAAALHSSPVEQIRLRADKLFPMQRSADAKPLPSIRLLARRTGDAQKGRIVFATTGTCAKCHVVNGEGKEVGPNLSEIGAKLSRPAIYESILFPSAGISHNFAAYTLVLQNGNVVTGILTNRTPDSIAIKGADAITRTYPTSEVEEIKEQSISLMPADLQKAMTADDLVNVVEYLTTLRHATPAKANGDPKKPTLTDHKEAAIAP